MKSLICWSRKLAVWVFVLLAAFSADAAEKPLPDVRVVTLAGDTLALKEICEGKPAFIFFWATWCKACSHDVRQVLELEKEFGEAVKIFGVSWRDSAPAIEAYFARKGRALATYIDADGSVFTALGFKQIPSVAILNAKGEVVFAGYGAFSKFKNLLLKQVKPN